MKGVGASLLRKEDDRYLRGQGEFVGDIKRPGTLEVAFARSPIAHGRIRSIKKPAGFESSGFVMDDLEGVKPIRAVSGLKGFKPSNLWPLAKDKVRHAGEPVAMCVGRTRAEAEDIASQVEVDYEPLPAVVDMVEARTNPPALVHEEWGDNVFLETFVDADFSEARKSAPIKVRRHLRTARQSMAPLEGRGVLCEW